MWIMNSSGWAVVVIAAVVSGEEGRREVAGWLDDIIVDAKRAHPNACAVAFVYLCRQGVDAGAGTEATRVGGYVLSLHSFIALRLQGRDNILAPCIRTCIPIFGLTDIHRLALALSSDFALDFAFRSRITLHCLRDPERVMTQSTHELATAPTVARMAVSAATAAGAEPPAAASKSTLTRSKSYTKPSGTTCRERRRSLVRLGSGGRST